MPLEPEEMSILSALSEPLAPKARSAYLEECSREIAARPAERGPGLAFRVGREAQSRYRDAAAIAVGPNGDRSRYR
jgi:hypothetical protein